jgi:hypothetical protein
MDITILALPKRFQQKIHLEGECWKWTAWKIKNGYGRVQMKDGPKLAHRAVYELLVGSIPEGLTLDHLCRNRICVNPQHLEPVSMRENVLRGIGPTAVNAAKVHCAYGHVLVWNGHQRTCIECKKAKNSGKPVGRKPQQFCKQGHDMSVNRMDAKHGCRLCHNERSRKNRLKLKIGE